jgi:hypothetical protein
MGGKIYSSTTNFDIFLIKIAIYLSLGLHKGRPSYRRSLQPSKKKLLHFKTLSVFVGHFSLLDLDPLT